MAREACLEEIIESTSASEPAPVPIVQGAHFETAFESVSASVDSEVGLIMSLFIPYMSCHLCDCLSIFH